MFFQNISAVLFDLDGTLVDTAPDLGAAADKMRVDRGLQSLDPDLYRPMAGAGARGMLGVAFGVSMDDASYAALCEEFLSNYAHGLMQRTVAFDGVPELIERMENKGIPWGVVTNKIARFTVPLTAAMPLFHGAGVIVSGDSTPYAKPHPEPLLEAARRLKVEPAQCMYVGDDERDMLAGLAAGMKTVAAGYGYLGSKTDIQQWGAHAQISFPLELWDLLGKV